MKKLVALFLSVGSFAGHAQVHAPTRADSAIHLNVVPNGRYSSAFYTVNQEPLTTATVLRLLKRYPPAAEELRKDRAQRRLVLLGLLPVCAAGLVVGGLQADQQRSVPGSNFSKAPVPFSLGLAALFGIVYVRAANHHFEKAIEAYNQRFH
jgi:hypothetical protein